MRHTKYNPAATDRTIRELADGQPDFIEITTPTTPGDELRILHGLGRIPKGYDIVKAPYQALNHGYGTTAWTTRALYLRFSLASTDLTISVY